MKNLIYIITSLALVSGLYSCENFFETQLELPTPEHTSVLAVTSFIKDTHTDLTTAVFRSLPLFDRTINEEDEAIDGATVRLYKGDELIQTFSNSEQSPFYNSPTLSEAFKGYGETFELRVSHPDFDDISATQTMPTPVELTDIEVSRVTNPLIGEENGEFELKLKIQDPAGVANFYEVYAEQEYKAVCLDEFGNATTDTITATQQVYFNTENAENPDVEQGYNYTSLLIKDELFDGRLHTIDPRFYEGYFYFDECDGGTERIDNGNKLKVYWRTITEEYYRFSLSLRKNSDAGENPFAEPVSVYTNFEGGAGVFALYSELIYDVE